MTTLDLGISQYLTGPQAQEWAARRWGVPVTSVTVESHAHPSSGGDQIATITVLLTTSAYRGIGYSGMAPRGYSMWWKAASDLLRQELTP